MGSTHSVGEHIFQKIENNNSRKKSRLPAFIMPGGREGGGRTHGRTRSKESH
jgi:hypothetical protein